MSCCNHYSAFVQKARPLVAETKLLYTKSQDAWLISTARNQLDCLANQHLQRVPGRQCEQINSARGLLHEWQRLQAELEALTDQGEQRYRELVAQVREDRRRLSTTTRYLTMRRRGSRRLGQPFSRRLISERRDNNGRATKETECFKVRG